MDDAAVMEAWQRCSTPNEKHKLIESMAGVFDVKATFWMEPGAPPMESTAKSVNEMVLGGLGWSDISLANGSGVGIRLSCRDHHTFPFWSN